MAGDGYVSPVLRIGSLFSGIGGLELGLEHATGGHVVWQVERDPWCRQVLARHWPDAARFDDVCTVGEDLSPVDLVCGGFPCQPASLAGQRKGMDDERWLWGEFARILRVVRPRFVLLENVAGLLSLDGGRAWGAVLGDLAALGFAAEWDVFRASDVGAPHRRERVFLVGVADREPRCVAHSAGGRREEVQRDARSVAAPGRRGRSAGRQQATHARGGVEAGRGDGLAQPHVGRGADGLPAGLDGRWPAGRGEAQHEWEAPRTVPKVPRGEMTPEQRDAARARAPRIKALGNAVVPQVAALAWHTLAARAGIDV